METIRQTFRSLREQQYYAYRLKDFIALFFLLIIWYTLHLLFQELSLLSRFFTSFFLLAFMTALATFLVRKFFIVLFMLLTAHSITKSLPDLSGLGATAYASLLICGVLFEVFYLLLYMETHVVPFDVILTLSFSFAALPLIAFLLTSPSLLFTHALGLLNLILIDFFLTLFAASLAFFIWYHLRAHPLFVRFEYAN